MDSDRFLEMKKRYIPFLDNMIQDFESKPDPNRRKALLNKMKSLRDLLMDENNRMKIDNLVKCERVLMNLFNKKDTITGTIDPESKRGNSDGVKNKLQSVVFKLQRKSRSTLPQLTRADKANEMCALGSKEPSFIHNRHHKSSRVPSISPSRMREHSSLKVHKNYSPRFLSTGSPTWINNQPEEQLSMKRHKKPFRQSSPCYKNEPKEKLPMSANVDQPDDVNIILNVPENSIDYFHLNDIVSRILKCNANDLDIETLGILRNQIIEELKENGVSENLSEWTLKSYETKHKKNKKNEEVEEGELSDSDSEIIEHIYGSLAAIDKDKLNKNEKPGSSDNEQSSKVEICLQIEEKKQKENSSIEENNANTGLDISDFESFNIAEKKNISFELNVRNDQSTKSNIEDQNINTNACEAPSVNKIQTDTKAVENEIAKTEITQKSNQGDIQIIPRINESDSINKNKSPSEIDYDNSDNYNKKNDVEIPLLYLRTSPPKTDNNEVSEIDILQALKNEILKETSNVLNTNVEAPLFQPKVSKVADAQEIGYKNRISIEKYKIMTKSVGDTDPETGCKDDVLKKQSLKLTEKEYERFFFKNTSFDSLTDTELISNLSVNDIHQIPAPKSPDHDIFSDISRKSPVIIPSDPVELPVATSEKDIDMRKNSTLNLPDLNKLDEIINDAYLNSNESQLSQLIDRRMNRESNILNNQGFGMSVLSPNVHLNSVQSSTNNFSSNLNQAIPMNCSNSNVIGNLTPKRSLVSLSPNFAPNVTPNRVQNIEGCMKNMTPSRHQALDNEESLNLKHVYTPIHTSFETQEYEERFKKSRWYCDNNIPFWKDVISNSDNNISYWKDVSIRNNMSNKIRIWENKVNSKNCLNSNTVWDVAGNSRNASIQRDNEYIPYDRYNVEAMDPNIWNDCQAPSGHPFGGIDYPPTPVPSHCRSGCSPTPTHPPGRQETPMNASHIFEGFNNTQATFGQKFNNPHNIRPYRNTDYDTYYGRDRGRGQKFHSNSRESEQSSRFSRSDSYRRFQREPVAGRSDRNKFYKQSDRVYREPESRREDGRHYIKDKEGEHFFTRNRGNSLNYEYRHHPESNSYYDKKNRRYQHERAMSRITRDSSRLSLNVGSGHCKDTEINDHLHSGSTFSNYTRYKFSFVGTKRDDTPKFDTRKQRASSVERTITDGTTESRGFHGSKKSLKVSESKTIRKPFRRSSSVGRDTKSSVTDFKDVKDSLKLFKLKSDFKVSTYFNKQEDSANRFLNSNVKYLPTNNNRDPRMHRDFPETATTHKDNKISDSRDSQSCGIIYSNYNITKGTVLESGQGVKNYKIPKIKRNTEVIDAFTSDIIAANKLKDNTENDCVNVVEATDIENASVMNLSDPNMLNFANEELSKSEHQSKDGKNILASETAYAPERRVTRSLTKKISGDKNLEILPVKITRKQKKPLVLKSNLKEIVENSTEENNSTEKNNLNISLNNTSSDTQLARSKSPLNIIAAGCSDKACSDNEKYKMRNDAPLQPKTLNVLENKIHGKSFLNPSLGQQCLGLNLKPLCGNLDNVTERKESNSGVGINDLETFVDNVSSDSVIDNINELIADLDEDLGLNLGNDKSTKVLCEDNMVSKLQDKKQNNLSEETKDVGNNNEFIVSISDKPYNPYTNLENKEESCEKVDDEVTTSLITSLNLTTSDSTNANNDILETKLNKNQPDSTDKSQSEMINCDVTSLNSETTTSQIESLDKFLSILQDKSKIKELLGLLDQSDECEKIKKKLEKICKIVCDDESTNNVTEEKDKYDSQKKKQEYSESNSLTDKNTSNVNVSEVIDDFNNSIQEADNCSTLDFNKEGIEVFSNIEDETISNQKEGKNSVSNKFKTDIKKVYNSVIVKRSPKKNNKKKVNNEDKRLTRSDAADLKIENPSLKKPSRELQKLQDDTREMLIRDGFLNSTGLRMCRLAKEANKNRNKKQDSTTHIKPQPVVVLTKCKDITVYEQDTATSEQVKKIGDENAVDDICNHLPQSSKIKPKDSKLHLNENEADSINEVNNSRDKNDTFGLDSDSLGSQKLTKIKKTEIRRRRKGWQSGIIKSKSKKKTNNQKLNAILNQVKSLPTKTGDGIPDLNCYVEDITQKTAKEAITESKEMQEMETIHSKTEIAAEVRSSESDVSFTEALNNKDTSTVQTNQNLNQSILVNKEVDNIESTNNIDSKTDFENDFIFDLTGNDDDPTIKLESDVTDLSGVVSEQDGLNFVEADVHSSTHNNSEICLANLNSGTIAGPADISHFPHFKIRYSQTGSKEYICCINGNKHYSSTLLISFQRHVQLKHSEKWNGYCHVCKVFVTPQGAHLFDECFRHFLDMHINNFPVEETPEQPNSNIKATITENLPTSEAKVTKTYVDESPILELFQNSDFNSGSTENNNTSFLPVIQSVTSLGTSAENPFSNPSNSISEYKSESCEVQYKYEENQTAVMTKKHPIVLDVMMSQNKLGHVFKCTGRFCSFTSNSVDHALLHAATHSKLGGQEALNCVYCDFECHKNVIDLITHVFNNHGSCRYICGVCFYRAAATQLVKAHIKRMHGTTTRVTILRTPVYTPSIDETTTLPRDVAVPRLFCKGDGDTEGGTGDTCTFGTYIPGKFLEHLQTRHASSNAFKCFKCPTKVATPSDLIQHFKSHSLKLYQCCYCVNGADNEEDFLAHASAFHPFNVPKAFLRIVTNKEGTSEYKVLPLAHFNQSNVYTRDFIPCNVTDNPVKEVERCIELEKLLGQPLLLSESIASLKGKEIESSIKNESEIITLQLNDTEASVTTQPEFINTTVSKITDDLSPEKNTEGQGKDVYCLESDEEPSIQKSNNSNSNAKTIATMQPEFITPTVSISTSLVREVLLNDEQVAKITDVLSPEKNTEGQTEDVYCLDSDEEPSIDKSNKSNSNAVTVATVQTKFITSTVSISRSLVREVLLNDEQVTKITDVLSPEKNTEGQTEDVYCLDSDEEPSTEKSNKSNSNAVTVATMQAKFITSTVSTSTSLVREALLNNEQVTKTTDDLSPEKNTEGKRKDLYYLESNEEPSIQKSNKSNSNAVTVATMQTEFLTSSVSTPTLLVEEAFINNEQETKITDDLSPEKNTEGQRKKIFCLESDEEPSIQKSNKSNSNAVTIALMQPEFITPTVSTPTSLVKEAFINNEQETKITDDLSPEKNTEGQRKDVYCLESDEEPSIQKSNNSNSNAKTIATMQTEFITPTVSTPTSLVKEALINNNQETEITDDLSPEKNTEDQRKDVYCLESDEEPLIQKSNKSNSNAVIIATMQPEFITPTVSTPTSLVKESFINNEQETKMTDDLSPERNMGDQRKVVQSLDSDEEPSIKNSNKSNSNESLKDKKVPLKVLFLCEKCKILLHSGIGLKRHMMWCYAKMPGPITCAHCPLKLEKSKLLDHYFDVHSLEGSIGKVPCSKCPRKFNSFAVLYEHSKLEHSYIANRSFEGSLSLKHVSPKKRKISFGSKEKSDSPEKKRRFGPQDVDLLPINPILEELVFCSTCEFKTKVRVNMVRHLQLHAQQQPVPQTAPVNPVPHLETNEKYFDKMVNLASSSIATKPTDKVKTSITAASSPPEDKPFYPKYVKEKHRMTCGAKGCTYISVDEAMLKCHWETLHKDSSDFQCVHCHPWKLMNDMSEPLTSCRIIAHLKMHDVNLFSCSMCTFYHHQRETVQKHLVDLHKCGQVVVVREEATPMTPTTISAAVTTGQIQTTASAMDLKLWHCGSCKFKSLFRVQVVDHCAKEHDSNMQYKCSFCMFRSSNTETIIKHQSKLHQDKQQAIFYCYYREGSDPVESQDNESCQEQKEQINENSDSPMKCDLPEIQISENFESPMKCDLPEIQLNENSDSPMKFDLPDIQINGNSDSPMKCVLPEIQLNENSDSPMKFDLPDIQINGNSDSPVKCDLPDMQINKNSDSPVKCDLLDMKINENSDSPVKCDLPDMQINEYSDSPVKCDLPDIQINENSDSPVKCDLPDIQINENFDSPLRCDLPDIQINENYDSPVKCDLPDIQINENSDSPLKCDLPDLQINENSDSPVKCGLPDIDDSSLEGVSKTLILPVDYIEIIKEELFEPVDEPIEELCLDFGAFCDPNGLKYKCPFCENVMEDDIESVQSHLHEELKYRKWGCSICSYKAFHRAGLSEHMQVEHCQNREPIALQVDNRVETWVNKLLEHQASLIEKHKLNLNKQKDEIFRVPVESSVIHQPIQLHKIINIPPNMSTEEVTKVFGEFGTPINNSYCCPKCNDIFENKELMQNHLELELNKIRWFCSVCYVTFQTFHEALFHCRSAHGLLQTASRPCEAPRDQNTRDNWVQNVLTIQSLQMTHIPDHQQGPQEDPEPENSLLEIRYAKKVSPDPRVYIENEEDYFNINKVGNKITRICSFCGQIVRIRQFARNHILKHYNLKPYDCGYCSFNGTKAIVINHQMKKHEKEPSLLTITTIPKEPLLEYSKKKTGKCPICKSKINALQVNKQLDPTNKEVSVAKKGDKFIKCNLCNKKLNDDSLQRLKLRPNTKRSATTTDLNSKGNSSDKKRSYTCINCNMVFPFMKLLKAHSKNNCSGTSKVSTTSVGAVNRKVEKKRKNEDDAQTPKKKIQKKSNNNDAKKLCENKGINPVVRVERMKIVIN